MPQGQQESLAYKENRDCPEHRVPKAPRAIRDQQAHLGLVVAVDRWVRQVAAGLRVLVDLAALRDPRDRADRVALRERLAQLEHEVRQGQRAHRVQQDPAGRLVDWPAPPGSTRHR